MLDTRKCISCSPSLWYAIYSFIAQYTRENTHISSCNYHVSAKYSQYSTNDDRLARRTIKTLCGFSCLVNWNTSTTPSPAENHMALANIHSFFLFYCWSDALKFWYIFSTQIYVHILCLLYRWWSSHIDRRMTPPRTNVFDNITTFRNWLINCVLTHSAWLGRT